MLTSCTIYEGTYDPHANDSRDHSHEVYFHNNLPYWGFHNEHYYYYGVAHIYPWWYWYTLLPPYTYSSHTHVSIHLNNTTIVRNPRGPKFNNGKGRTYSPNNVTKKSNGNRNIRVTSNKTNYIRTTKTNRSNIKINTNRNAIKINTNKKVRTNTKRNHLRLGQNGNHLGTYFQ